MYILSNGNYILSHYSWAQYFRLDRREAMDFAIINDGERQLFIGANFNIGIGWRQTRDGKIERLGLRGKSKLVFPVDKLIPMAITYYWHEKQNTLFEAVKEGRFQDKALILSPEFNWRLTRAKLMYTRKIQ